MRFTISKPAEPTEMELMLKNEPLGKEFKRKITLSTKESGELACIQNMREKQAYLENLPAAKEALRELTKEAGLCPKASDT